MLYVHAFFMHMYQFCFYHIDIKLFGAFLLVSPSLLLSYISLLSLPPLILLFLMSGSVMIKPVKTFRRTSHDEAFIRNAKSFYQIFLILTFLLSSIVGVGSHCVASWSLVPP